MLLGRLYNLNEYLKITKTYNFRCTTQSKTHCRATIQLPAPAGKGGPVSATWVIVNGDRRTGGHTCGVPRDFKLHPDKVVIRPQNVAYEGEERAKQLLRGIDAKSVFGTEYIAPDRDLFATC